MKRVILCIILFFSFSSVFAATFPNYSLENKYVTDTIGVISPEWKTQITTLCAEIEQNTSAQIAVVTINSTEELSIEQYAVELFEKWGIGQKEADNGLLILVAVSDRAYRIEVGYGLEGVLNDAKVGRIGREYFVPYFQSEQYGEGIYLAIQTISAEIKGEGSPISTNVQSDYTPIIFFAIFTALWLMPLILRTLAKKYGKEVKPGHWLLWGMMINTMGRGRGGFGGGGFSGGGGFGGGGSGGGGASGRW